MNGAASEFVYLALDVSFKVVLLAAVAGAGLAMLAVRNSNVLHRAWTLVLAGMLLMPLLVAVTPGVPVPSWLYPAWQASARGVKAANFSAASPKSSPTAMNAIGVPLAKSQLPSDAHAASGQMKTVPDGDAKNYPPATAGGDTRARNLHAPAPNYFTSGAVPTILFLAYLAGATCFMARLMIGLWRASQLRRRAQPVSLSPIHAKLAGSTLVRQTRQIRVPLTVGWRRPCILLPSDWSSWHDSLLAAALTHERAHVERRDQWVTLVAELNRAIYWFHPMAWFLRHRLATLAEQACDDAVVEQLGDRTSYAHHLLAVAGRLGNMPWRIHPASVAMARTPRVEQRINAILDITRPLASKLGTTGAIVLLAVALPLVLLAAGLKGADGSTESTPAASEASPTVEKAVSQAESAATPLRGRVVMKFDGSPVPNADVRLVTWSQGDTHYDTKKTRSDDQGNFEFKVIPSGKNRLVAFSGDLASRQSLYKGAAVETPADGKALEPVTLEMTKCPSIAVHVTAKADSKPIAGALVRLVWTDTEQNHYTNDQGEVTLPRLTHEVWHVEVHAKGFAEEVQAINLAETELANVSFELVPGGVLYGSVLDEAGTPVAGAGISAFPANFSGEQIEYMVTDHDGKYRFSYLPLDKGLELDVSKEAYTRTRQQTSLADAPNHERKLDLVLKQRPNGGAVGGKVVGPDGKPIAGATIANHGKSSTEVRTATADANGEFLLADVYEGSIGHELIAKAQGFAPQRLPFQPGTPDKPAEIAISLAAGHRIQGKLVDEGGNPIAAAQVYFANGNWGDGMDFGGQATTGADGRFTFDSLPDRTPFNVVARGYSEINGQQLPLDGDAEVVVTMRSAGIIHGRIVDDKTGLPVTSFNVSITFSPDRKPDEPDTGLTGPRATSPNGERFANSDGVFRLDGLVRDMPLQVTVVADGYDRETVRRVVATADADAKAVEFRLKPLGSLGETQIRGHLVDSDSKPVAGAEVRLIVAETRPFPRDRYPFNWQMIRSGQVQSTG
ncbi:MAG TPA: carboxypeptidase regulatory-like domain-containing protein, partial [Lacipirellulaceae bacterium]